jgi:3-oxoacyl-(acyl-carrier-protein) synthase
MEVYINGLNAISPQDTISETSLSGILREYNDVRFLKCIEPKYSAFIDPMASRRMSRIVKMGLTSALCCLKSSEVNMPGAIVTGTGLGCIEDTTKFLSSLYENEEKLLNPTPFIQSTHNTVSATIAQNIKCNNYNNTYCDSGFSFENALLDSMMLIGERSADNVLVGGVDELTPALFSITDRLGFWKRKPVNSFDLLCDSSHGSIAGEGASFFLLGSQKNQKSYCSIDGLRMLYKPAGVSDIEKFLTNMFSEYHLDIAADIDLVIMGYNGDQKGDNVYSHLRKEIFLNCPAAFYKNLCGEYQTSISFALYLAARILKEQEIPPVLLMNKYDNKEIKKILIYNHVRNMSHSAILVSKC